MAEAKAANAAKGQFLANVSHELRTPLNAIIGFSSALNEQTFGALANDKQREYVIDILRSGQNLLAHINDLLDLSAIEAGKLELHVEPVSVNAIVEKARKTITAAGTDRIRIVANGDDSAVSAFADERRLGQILLNLMSNASKFSPPDSGIEVSIRKRSDGGVRITVRDHGPGMNAEELAIAMDSFGQVHSGDSGEHQGTGLGLPLTKHLVELHGGTFRLESTKGTGTTAVVVLPGPSEISLSA
jgi:signal transduction histidine kinase